jgi:hypothetical protein
VPKKLLVLVLNRAPRPCVAGVLAFGLPEQLKDGRQNVGELKGAERGRHGLAV